MSTELVRRARLAALAVLAAAVASSAAVVPRVARPARRFGAGETAVTALYLPVVSTLAPASAPQAAVSAAPAAAAGLVARSASTVARPIPGEAETHRLGRSSTLDQITVFSRRFDASDREEAEQIAYDGGKAAGSAPEPAYINAAAVLRRLLARPLPARKLRALQARWRAIDAKKSNVSWSAAAAKRLTAARQGLSATIKGRAGPAAHGDDAKVAQSNWIAADRMIRSWADSGAVVTMDKISRINAVLGEGLDNNGNVAGRLRRHGAFAASVGKVSFLHVYPDPEDLPALADDFVRWYQANAAGAHPILLAASAYQRLVSYHFFSDANGRTARFVADWILLSHGLPLPLFDKEPNVALLGLLPDAVNVAPDYAAEVMTRGVERSLQLAAEGR